MINPAYSFRPAEEWKSALTNLPLFFELMRSIFGNIKTPYNKQKLIDDLVVFLSRDDIQKAISAYIGPEDRRIIAATALLDDPTPGELEDFLQGEKNIVTLRGSLMNLEERLILYRFVDNTQTRRIALNPVLEQVLAPVAAQTGVLFSCEDIDDSQQENPVSGISGPESSLADDRVLGVFIAFISGEEEFFKADGVRKRIQEQAKKLFPGIDPQTGANALRSIGLFNPDGDRLIPDNRKITGFAGLSPAERREYMAAGFCIHLNDKNNFYQRNQAGMLAGLINRFCCFLDPEKKYPETTIRRLVMYLETEKSRSQWNTAEKISHVAFIKALEASGILVKIMREETDNADNAPKEFWKYEPVKTGKNDGAVIAMDSDFTFVIYPGITFGEIMKLAVFSQVSESAPFNFEITRSSAVRGFDTGLRAKDMTETLAEFSGNKMDESLVWTLNDWESRYNAVFLHEGLILGLSEERQYLAETGPIASMITKKLSQGLYLLSCSKPEASAALEKAGVDIIAKPDINQRDFSGITGRLPFSREPSRYTGIFSVPQNTAAENQVSANLEINNSCEALKKHFRDYLAKLRIPPAEKDELTSRIERRVILTESQLEKAAFKFRKLEARGLDYAGKNAVVKQAIADGSLLEITLPDLEKGTAVTTGIPSALEKKGGEGVLVLKPVGQDSTPENTIRIPLGKISHLRMIRQSIFNN